MELVWISDRNHATLGLEMGQLFVWISAFSRFQTLGFRHSTVFCPMGKIFQYRNVQNLECLKTRLLLGVRIPNESGLQLFTLPNNYNLKCVF